MNAHLGLALSGDSGGVKGEGRAKSPASPCIPHLGARVAPQRCPILRVGRKDHNILYSKDNCQKAGFYCWNLELLNSPSTKMGKFKPCQLLNCALFFSMTRGIAQDCSHGSFDNTDVER